MHLALEISSGIIAGLVVIPFVLTAIRTLVDGKAAPWVVGDIAAAEKRVAGQGWLHRSLGAFDVLVNVMLLRGQADETVSTHSYRAFLEGKTWGKAINAWLNLWQASHGSLATTGDYYRALVRVSILGKILGIST